MAKSTTKNVVVSKLERIREVCRKALELEDAIKEVLDEEEVQKQTWADLETDWPFADAPNNLVNADGLLVLTQDASRLVSFSGADIRSAVKRLETIHLYLQGTAGGTPATISVEANPNRDIAKLTIDP